jgi:predicted phosphodiesterase
MNFFRWDTRHFRMAHATPHGDLFEYVAAESWGERITELAADIILLGHTHVQDIRVFGNVLMVNPGSVGLARDGGGEACYAVWNEGELTLRRVPYDVARTIVDLDACPLPKEVVNGLSTILNAPKFSLNSF